MQTVKFITVTAFALAIGTGLAKRTTKKARTTLSSSPGIRPTETSVQSIASESEDYGWYKPMEKACRLQVPDERNIILTYQNHPKALAPGADILIPHGAVLLARCPVLGAMKLLGPSSVECNNGKWNKKLPTCLPTTPADGLSPFIDDHPPTIAISIPVGSAGENAAGELVVRPRSVVHLDCVFYRRLGSPVWIRSAYDGNATGTNSHPTGWAIARDERLWRFRTSMFSIVKQDEGEYTCVTPRGHSNSVRIAVQTIECPPLARAEPPLNARVEGNFAGQSIHYSCVDGYKLEGPVNTTCLTSGTWSETRVPTCRLIECPYDIDGADARLEFDFLNGAGFLAMVKFSCPPGYQLVGANNATCRDDMNWFPPPPSCEVIECPELLPPLNGRIIDSGSGHFVGDAVKFSCNRNFLLVGHAEISCSDDGTWSHPPPHCQLLCPNPGEPGNGAVYPNASHYEIGVTVQVSCATGYKLTGRPWLVCQQDGTWSSAVGHCATD